MMEQQGYLKIDRNGRTLVFGDALKRSLCHQVGYYELEHQEQDQVMFKRVSSIPRHSELREPIVFQGDIGGIGSTIEVINFVISARLDGQLTLVQGEVRKSLFFKSGELCAARSNHLNDRLSEVLYRYGALEREVIEAAEEYCDHHKRPLGNYLLSQGELTQGQLFLYFKKQVEEIFFSTLLWSRGEFYFTTPHVDQHPSPLKLNAQQLLLEGVKRADEMRSYRETFTSEQTIVVASESGAEYDGLSEELSAILTHLQQPRTMRELVSYFRIGNFLMYQRVYQLYEQGFVSIEGQRASYQDRLSIEELIMLFNRSFGMIAQYAQRHDTNHSLVEGLEIFLKFHQNVEVFRGASYDERGHLDSAILMSNLTELGGGEDLNVMGHALCELFFLQMFVARTWLSGEEYHELREVYDEISLLVSA